MVQLHPGRMPIGGIRLQLFPLVPHHGKPFPRSTLPSRPAGAPASRGVRRLVTGVATPETASRGGVRTSASNRYVDSPPPCDALHPAPRIDAPRIAGQPWDHASNSPRCSQGSMSGSVDGSCARLAEAPGGARVECLDSSGSGRSLRCRTAESGPDRPGAALARSHGTAPVDASDERGHRSSMSRPSIAAGESIERVRPDRAIQRTSAVDPSVSTTRGVPGMRSTR